jgi:hypothetical protein
MVEMILMKVTTAIGIGCFILASGAFLRCAGALSGG